MSWSDTTPAPAVAGTPSYPTPPRRAEPNATSPENPLWRLVLHMRSSSREETMVEQSVNLPTAIYLGVFSRAEQRVLQAIFKAIAEWWRQMCRYPRNARPRLEHQQANHAQCDRPSGRNRPSRKDRAPVLLRCFVSQLLAYGKRCWSRKVLTSDSTALVEFCGLLAESKAWMKSIFSTKLGSVEWPNRMSPMAKYSKNHGSFGLV